MKTQNPIETYKELLKTYNETTNIYSKKSYNKLDNHINDCITLSSIITNTKKTILDIGSGSGLPSIIIAIQNPNNTVIAVESKSRKTKFLNHIVKNLQLKNITIINQNINEWLHTNTTHIDIITAKAFGSSEKVEKLTQKINNRHKRVYIPISKEQSRSYKDECLITKHNFIYFTKLIN